MLGYRFAQTVVFASYRYKVYATVSRQLGTNTAKKMSQKHVDVSSSVNKKGEFVRNESSFRNRIEGKAYDVAVYFEYLCRYLECSSMLNFCL